MEIFSTDISERKGFAFQDDTLKQCEYNEETGLWLYERYTPKGRLMGYEMVRGVRKVNPNGEVVHSYPSSEQFGNYGWFYPPRSNKEELVKAMAIADKKDRQKYIHKNALNWK